MLFTVCIYVFFFKQKTAYEMLISDWSSDVGSSDLAAGEVSGAGRTPGKDRSRQAGQEIGEEACQAGREEGGQESARRQEPQQVIDSTSPNDRYATAEAHAGSRSGRAHVPRRSSCTPLLMHKRV